MKDQTIQKPGICESLDTFVLKIGRITSWLNVLLIAIITFQVIMRYIFSEGMVFLEELQWHLYAVCIMFGISYALVDDAHIRLDILHQRFSKKNKELVDLCGMVFLLIPFVAILLYYGIDFTMSAYAIGEKSPSPLGLPCRWIVKGVFPASMLLLFIASVSRALRAAVFIFKSRSYSVRKIERMHGTILRGSTHVD